ncbi:tumor necrosis factor receptor superfamily member 14-like isoform X1 [Epinephelus fuscoguttatus]|uniref:tumor necrosis factor receptor superfamily member 14-like isoform X1 n=1 Tax=Epinephelus fuscoguttatus TaxID=293821 RepID=UPI0020D13A9F|nr:tumor necrosis factor receptor superfamily member 14-like isoform X1 [Epinephelus fuscoguttatus]
MLSILAVFGCVAVFMVPGLCCREKEYATSNGECCPMCHEGTVVKRDCTPFSGTRCVPCVNGTYMNQPNGLNKCFPCTSCDQGLFAKQQCTATRDTVCGVLEGYFCKLRDDTGCSLAQKHTPCESGHRIKTPGTSTSDTECEPCQHGFFSEHGVNCTAWTICSETQVKTHEGDAHSDVVCKAPEPRVHYFLSIPFSLLSFTIVWLLIKGMSKSQKKSDHPRALRDI